MVKKEPKKMGRPKLGPSLMEETVLIRMPHEVLALMDKARQTRAPLVPARSAVIREWIVEGAQRWIAEAQAKR